jgi:hypothetical protein
MRRVHFTLFAAAAMLAATPALACSLAPRTHEPTPQEIERLVLQHYGLMTALVEIVVTADSSAVRSGTARVVRVYKGPVRIGQQYRMRGLAGSACGAGDMTRGMRGLIYVGAQPPTWFPGFVQEDTLRILRGHGLAVHPVR